MTPRREVTRSRCNEGCSLKKVVKPTARKQAAKYMIENGSLSQRAACRLAGISRSAYVYRTRPPNDAKLRERLKKLAAKHSSYGYLFLHALLKKDKFVVNKKRTYRIYREEGLQVRTKARRKLQRPRMPMEVPNQVNQRWSMDFVADQLSNGRRFRVLNVVDDYNREMVGQLVSISISGRQVARFLDDLILERQRPKTIICDNGTEFTCKAMFFWSQETGVKLGFIQPGKPTQNAFVESLNGKFRKECLNAHWFRSLDAARDIIDQWRHHYNHERPHSSLNYLSPVEFAQQAA